MIRNSPVIITNVLMALIYLSAISNFSALNSYPFAFTIKSHTCSPRTKAFNRESKPTLAAVQTPLTAKLIPLQLRLLHNSFKHFCKPQTQEYHGNHRVCV